MNGDSFRTILREQPVHEFASTMVNHGRAFIISDMFKDVGNNDSIFLYLENPEGSDFDYDVILIPKATDLVDITISSNATENTQGVDADVENLRSSSNRSFTGIARKTQTTDTDGYDHGNTFLNDFVSGNTTGTEIGPVIVGGVSFTIDEGSNKLIELNNVSGGGTSRISISAIVFEVDGTYKDVPKFV